jgi:Cadherin-like/Putative Ig domain/FG-GAP repeat
MQQKTFDLTTLNGANGFTIPGVCGLGDGLGSSVSGAGDINGDNITDFVVGDWNCAYNYVIFGSRMGFPAVFDLNTLNGSNGFTIPQLVSGGTVGYSATSAGDINGDNITDLVLGSLVDAIYVIFGSRMDFPAVFNLNTLNGSNGFTVTSIPNGRSNIYVNSAGDINDDGVADLVLGAPGVSSSIGSVYVIFGNRSGFPAVFNVSDLNGSNGFTIPGIAGALGSSVSNAGDINGDNITDIVLGASQLNSANGASYVLFGSRSSFPAVFNVSKLNGSNGFTIPGITGALGTSVSNAGDINGDNITDIVLGAPGAAPGGNSFTGFSYVLFGSRSGFSAVFNLTNLNGSNGFVIYGIASDELFGQSVAGGGDINGDDVADLVLGAPGDLDMLEPPFGLAYTNFIGESYVIFGSRGGFPAVFNLSDLNGNNGFNIPGLTPGSLLGTSVSSAGDINGDGFADLLLGATDMGDLEMESNLPGSCYVLFGGVIFNNNTLTITEGQTVLLSNANLSVYGLTPIDSLTYVVTRIQGGRFTFVNNSNTAIFNFTPTQINNGQIQFVSDRTNVVAFQVGVANIISGQILLAPTPAKVTFIDPGPVVLNAPATQVINVNQPFNFVLLANQIFNDTDGDPLTYSAELSSGSVLPHWLQFDSSQPKELSFQGTAPVAGTTHVLLTAKDPINVSISTGFDILAIPNNGTIVNKVEASTSQIIGSVVGGVVALVSLLTAGFIFWRDAADKNTRKSEFFADLIRTELNLKGVDNFNSYEGQKFVSFIHELQSTLKTAGIDPTRMRPQEIRILADDVADAARNKISPVTDCSGHSVITVADLNDNLQSLVNEVQVLRAGGQKFEV